MDSLTQITLGAAVGEAVLGRQVGRKAMFWGAVCGTLPDLDVLIKFGDPVMDFTLHRSFSHSIFVLTLLTPFFAWLIVKLHPPDRAFKRQWAKLIWLAFMTHIFLDCFTVYGTQIFWPLWNYPIGWGSVFIIDPIYTVFLLCGVIAVLAMGRENNLKYRLNHSGLVLSSVYLIWSIVAQQYAIKTAEASLARQSIQYSQLLVVATPLNTFLWRLIALQSDGNYYEGFYSLLDQSQDVFLEEHVSHNGLLAELDQHWPVMRLKWFTKGFFKVWQHSDGIAMSDLRMGIEPNYVFSFIVAKSSNPHTLPIKSERISQKRDVALLKKIWGRIWSSGMY
ncbi:MAG: metal-dependent hydrolase [Deltaproteobacteria bacterium]|jgi:inner membrane protein|nr:metal-dependent hydrolase [Deltaproteobacteria bacterium]MBW2504598.1 metal-dependent hydrolase [Deltaproteobacteria bacterium]